MCDRKNHIELNYSSPEENYQEKMFISYVRDEDYFTCKYGTTKITIKLKNVEKFIKVWYNHKKDVVALVPFNRKWFIYVYINRKLFSGYHFSGTVPGISFDTIQSYIVTLKDIIEENDEESVRQVDKAVGDYNILEGEKVGNYDTIKYYAIPLSLCFLMAICSWVFSSPS